MSRGSRYRLWTSSVWLSGLVLVPAVHGTQGAGDPPNALAQPIVFVQERVEDPQTTRLVRLDPDGRLTTLTTDFVSASDPDVSFDGESVLFAARRKTEDPWQIWRMAGDGSATEQVTDLPGDAREPIWLAPAAVNSPTFDQRLSWIGFVSTAAGVFDDRREGALQSLYAMSLEPAGDRGQITWRTTYDLGGNGAPTILQDGRVLFSSRQHEGWALMTISWAGENLNSFYGSHDAWSQWSAVELPELGRVLFVERRGEGGQGREGRLASVQWRRPLHSHQVLAADGLYRTPGRLSDGSVIVSWRENEATSYGLYRFDPAGDGRGELIFDDPAWHDVDAKSLASRPLPRGRIPTVDFASVLDVEGFEDAGQLQCLNVYETDREHISPAPGQVAAVRLMEGIPTALTTAIDRAARAQAGEDWPPAGVTVRSLGTAPVEADGSFYVNVAGDVPFYVETLDSQGQVVDVMRAWTWVRSGDQRGCIGCHEDRELAPENRATQALRRSEPAHLMGPRSGEAP